MTIPKRLKELQIKARQMKDYCDTKVIRLPPDDFELFKLSIPYFSRSKISGDSFDWEGVTIRRV
jgi:hypothetical protein